MKWLKLAIISSVAVIGLGLAFAPATVLAQSGDPLEDACLANPDASYCKKIADPEAEVSSTVRNIINALLFAIGLVAIISIIISGIKFVSSRGDSSAVQKARSQLIYSVVGLVIAVSAFAIVNFVISRINDSTGTGGSGSSGGGGTTAPCTIPGQVQDPSTGVCACPGGAPATGNPLECP